MKAGDIVYFKSQYTALYGKQGGSYHCIPGVKYRIDSINDGFSGDITNLEDGTTHFAHSDIWSKLISLDEWRKLQLDKII
jgi:hypothetical protein